MRYIFVQSEGTPHGHKQEGSDDELEQETQDNIDTKDYEYTESNNVDETNPSSSSDSEAYSDYDEDDDEEDEPNAQEAPATGREGVLDSVATNVPSSARPKTTTIPIWLRGGEKVAPLRAVLGKALSLLYITRHGLHESELRAVLNHILIEEKSSGIDSSPEDVR